jgi:hypothetical protein
MVITIALATGNHLAMISAWALFAVSFIASAEKNDNMLNGAVKRTLSSAEAVIGNALAFFDRERKCLLAEVRNELLAWLKQPPAA